MKMWNASTLSLLFALLTGVAVGQPAGIVIDRVVAVLGREAILHSEVTARSEQARQNGSIVDRESTCGELEDLLFEKLLIEQGRIDSVVVDDVQVDRRLDRRKELTLFKADVLAELLAERVHRVNRRRFRGDQRLGLAAVHDHVGELEQLPQPDAALADFDLHHASVAHPGGGSPLVPRRLARRRNPFSADFRAECAKT